MMHSLFLLSLFFLPMLYAEDHQVDYDGYRQMIIPRSMAANYLCMYYDENMI